MTADDRIYEALIRADHRPDAIDRYEITHTALLFDEEEQSAYVESVKARQRGEKMLPASPTAHATKGGAVAAALAAHRAQED